MLIVLKNVGPLVVTASLPALYACSKAVSKPFLGREIPIYLGG